MTLAAFTADISASLGGPAWLVQRRTGAWDRLSAAAWPRESEEVWRYSGIDRFDLDAFAPASRVDADRATAVGVGRAAADALGPRAALVVTSNGSVVGVEVDASVPEGRLTVASVRSDADAPAGLGDLAPAGDAFGHLHDAFLADVVRVSVPAKAVLADPVVVVHLVDRSTATGPVSAFPRTLVHVGTSAEVGVIELIASADRASADRASGDGRPPALVVPVAELDVEDNAHLAYVTLQVLDQACTYVGAQASRVGRDAVLRSFTAGLGGGYARLRTDSDLVGQGGRTALLAAYLATDGQVHDFRTLQDHHAPRTESELLFKGAVADRARSVYSGLIHVRHGARGAHAFQSNHNLVLSEGAHADSVPNLDIEENDVKCSHASTVGPIDADQCYYLESRGIEPAVAERLIVRGFFSDLASRAPLTEVGRWVDETVGRRLAGRLPSERTSFTGGDDG